jgi:hypothetical protein
MKPYNFRVRYFLTQHLTLINDFLELGKNSVVMSELCYEGQCFESRVQVRQIIEKECRRKNNDSVVRREVLKAVSAKTGL